jgi:hypothetical protein
MRRLSISLLAAIFVCGLFFVPVSAHARERRLRKYTPPPPMGSVTVTVLRDSDGKPLRNAAVVFHTQQDGKVDGNMELKTNEDGKATLSIVPIGNKVLVQVIAQGYRTFGREYDVPKSKNFITVRLLPPDRQYSLYDKKDNGGASDLQTNTPKTQMGAAAPADSPLLTPPEKKD